MEDSNEKICEFLTRGDRRGMDLLFDKYFEPLVLWAHTFINDLNAAQDLVQDFFISSWKDGVYKSWQAETLSAYLYVAVKNRCYNKLKRKDVLRDTFDIESLQILYEEYQKDKDHIISKVLQQMDRLPERGKEVMHCVYVKGMKYEETANELGVSIATVKTHLVRSLKTLRKHLSRQEDLLLFILFQKK